MEAWCLWCAAKINDSGETRALSGLECEASSGDGGELSRNLCLTGCMPMFTSISEVTLDTTDAA